MLGKGGFFEDGLGGCGPDQGNGVLVVLGEIVVDCGFQLGDALEGARAIVSTKAENGGKAMVDPVGPQAPPTLLHFA